MAASHFRLEQLDDEIANEQVLGLGDELPVGPARVVAKAVCAGLP